LRSERKKNREIRSDDDDGGGGVEKITKFSFSGKVIKW
jgi:hypothetical protein